MIRKRLASLLLFLAASAVCAQSPNAWTQWPSTWIRWDSGNIVSFYSQVQNNGTNVPQEQTLNFVPGTNITFSFADNPGTGVTSITINSSAGGGGLADPGGNGVVVRTALNTTINRTMTAANTSLTITNADGTAGNPTYSTTVNTTDDGGAIVKQAATPGTQQGSGGNANINTNGTWIEELDALANTATDGVIVQNTTASTSTAPNIQQAPIIKLCGTAWNSGGSASEIDCWRIQNLPATNAGTTTSSLRFLSSIAGGAYTAPMTLTNAGAATFTGSMTVSAQQVTITGGGSAPLVTETGNVAGTGGLNMTLLNGGSSLLTGQRFVSASCTSGTTCDSGTNLAANAVPLSLTWRVTTAITGATTINLGTATNGTAFCTGLTGAQLSLNATGVCGGGATVGSGVNGAAVAIRATATAGTFTAGVIEYEITYILATPPTS